MGFFNFIETFFFISLGITFVLILLLVYHFKQRICTLEEKGTTMFEIVNGVVKELTNIKRMVIQNSIGNMSIPMPMPSVNVFSKTNPEIMLKNEDLLSPIKFEINSNTNMDDASEYDESSDEENTESEEDVDSTENDNHNETTEDNIKIINYNDVIENTDENIDIGYVETPIYDITEDDLSSVEEELLSVYDKDVNIDIDIPVVIKLDNNAEQDHVEKAEEEEEEQEEEEDTEEDIEQSHVEEDIEQSHVEEDTEEDIEPLPILSIKEKDESYKRLNVNQLKAVVISKGITTDTTKMKKNDLIKLLENFE
jgi:hypothetical protein